MMDREPIDGILSEEKIPPSSKNVHSLSDSSRAVLFWVVIVPSLLAFMVILTLIASWSEKGVNARDLVGVHGLIIGLASLLSIAGLIAYFRKAGKGFWVTWGILLVFVQFGAFCLLGAEFLESLPESEKDLAKIFPASSQWASTIVVLFWIWVLGSGVTAAGAISERLGWKRILWAPFWPLVLVLTREEAGKMKPAFNIMGLLIVIGLIIFVRFGHVVGMRYDRGSLGAIVGAIAFGIVMHGITEALNRRESHQ